MIAQYKFYARPLVWLEGVTDYAIFAKLLQDGQCVIKTAGGVEECRALARAMVDDDLPFVVVMDGDYGILTRKRSWHRRVVVLRRHSIENYCAEADVVAAVCCGYSEGRAQEREVGRRFGEFLEEVENELAELVLLDVVSQQDAGWLGPKSVDELLASRRPLEFDREKIRRTIGEIRGRVGTRCSETSAREELKRFVARKRFVDVVRGHWVFVLIRWFMAGELSRVDVKMRLDDKALRYLFASEMWKRAKSEDHVSLRRCLGRAIREAKRMRCDSR